MIDYSILKEFGTTNQRLREVFTAQPGTVDGDIRAKFEKKIQSRVQQGVDFNLDNYEVYAVSDLAWDGNILTKEILPLTMMAQGRIDMKSFVTQCKASGITEDELRNYCTCEEKEDGAVEFKDVDLSKMVELNVNMVRSMVQRRHAAQVSKYLSQFPFLKYESYDKSYEAQLKSDAMSQRVEIMANQYGYRHQLSQNIRDFLLYPHVVEFPAEAWHVEKQYRKAYGEDGEDLGTESYVVREGVPFVTPHPSRVFWDVSHPLSSINSDTGCDYFGYWEIVKFGDIAKNTAYFNRDSVFFTNALSGTFADHPSYTSIYYPGQMDWPGSKKGGRDTASRNDRENNTGVYNGDLEDSPVVMTEYRERIIPKDYGIGSYPYPVWVRLVVASENTVVFAEIMPDIPAQYYGYNEKDNRLTNISFAHEVMPWQDQLSRIMTQLNTTMQHSLFKVLGLNIGLMSTENVQSVRNLINSKQYTSKPLVIEYDTTKLKNLDMSKETFTLEQASQSANISDLIRTAIELNVFAERTLNLSPQEQGQPSPRVTSATEILEIANTVNTLYNFISKAIDEGLSAKKRYLYNSIVSKSEGDIHLAIIGTYPDEVIEKAGFNLESDSLGDGRVKQQFISGSPIRLVYDYVFNSREGGDRTSNVKVAEVLTNLLPQILQVPGMIEAMGTDKIYEVLNAIMRNAGAAIEFKLTPREEQAQSEQTGQQRADEETLKSSMQEMIQVLGDISAQTEQNTAQIEQLEELEEVAKQLLGGAMRTREQGQRFEGGPIEAIPTQGQPQQRQALPGLERQPEVAPEPLEATDPFSG